MEEYTNKGADLRWKGPYSLRSCKIEVFTFRKRYNEAPLHLPPQLYQKRL